MEEQEKVTWKGWLSLLFLVVAFSGATAGQDNFLKAFDLNTFVGAFGHGADGKVSFLGTGGFGAREGLMVALSLIPTVMMAQGLLEVCEHLGALLAASKLFHPLLKPLLGIPGTAGLAFVSSFTSSDVGSFMTRDMYEEGIITDDERTVFTAYQYAGSAVINNTIAAGAAMLPVTVIPVGAIIGIIIIVKIIGANFVRLYLKFHHKRHGSEVA